MYKLTVAPVVPGEPQSTSFPFTSFTLSFLDVAISSRYLFQSTKLSLGLLLARYISAKE